MTLLEEFAQLLDDLDLGTFKADGTTGGTLYTTELPSTPDRCIAIARYGGSDADSRLPYDEPSIQFRIRGGAADARQAETDAQAVYDALHGLGMRELAGGTWLQLIVCKGGGPTYIGRDQSNRPEYTVNASAGISRATSNRSSL